MIIKKSVAKDSFLFSFYFLSFNSDLIRYNFLNNIYFLKRIIKKVYFNINKPILLNYAKGDWGLGMGDWGLGIGGLAQSPIPNPQTPIPNPLGFIQYLSQLI